LSGRTCKYQHVFLRCALLRTKVQNDNFACFMDINSNAPEAAFLGGSLEIGWPD